MPTTGSKDTMTADPKQMEKAAAKKEDKIQEQIAASPEVKDGKLAGGDAQKADDVHAENMERFTRNAAGNDPADQEQVVDTATSINEGRSPEVAAMENDPDIAKGPTELQIAARLTEEAESAISTANQNRQAHPVVKPESGDRFSGNVGAVLEATAGTSKLEAILNDIGDDTPDNHVLFGRNGIAFTVGDLRGTGLKKTKKK